MIFRNSMINTHIIEHTTIDNTLFEIENYYTPGTYNPPLNAHYTQIDCVVKPENIGKLVGENGRIFNAITRAAHVNYLWFDNSRNVIEIWGPEKNLENAKQRLIERMEKIELN